MTDADAQAKTTPTKPILGYWKIRGLASAIRYQLAYSKVDYDEEVYEQGDGPEFSRASWMDVKYTLGLQYPNVPYFKDGDFSLTESGAIQRYCAKKWCPELLCLDDDEAYGKAEMAWGVCSDLKGFVTSPCYVGDGDKKALAEKAIPRFAAVAKTLADSKYIAGDQLCCADFGLAELIDVVDFISEGEIFKTHPSLKEYRDRVFELPGVKECHEKEQKLSFNNKSAKINNL